MRLDRAQSGRGSKESDAHLIGNADLRGELEESSGASIIPSLGSDDCGLNQGLGLLGD